MGERITHRSRPRVDAAFSTMLTDTVADMTDSGFIGPFTPAQLMELWFRVKTIRIQASVAWSQDNPDPDPPTTGTSTIDIYLSRWTSDETSAISYETEIFRDWGNNGKFFFHDGGLCSFASYGTSTQGFIKDENSDLWMTGDGAGNLAIPASESSDGVTGLIAYGDDTPPAGVSHVFTGTALEFHDGSTVPLVIVALPVGVTEITGTPTASVEITEWFPYMDKGGLAAWATSTGLSANGGPGG